MNIRIAGDLENSLANGPGMRYVLFTQGCSLKCPGCHNAHTWDKSQGMSISIDEVIENIKSNPFIEGVTLSGGDPVEQIEAITELCKRIKSELPQLTIMMYTGRKFAELLCEFGMQAVELIELLDYMVDGRFEMHNKEGAHKYAGSANQVFYDFKKDREENKLPLAN